MIGYLLSRGRHNLQGSLKGKIRPEAAHQDMPEADVRALSDVLYITS